MSEVKQFVFSFRDLDIHPSHLAEMMGFDDPMLPDPFPSMIEEAIAAAPGFCEIKGGFTIQHHPDFDEGKTAVIIGGKSFLPGKIVYTQTKPAKAMALFLCTAGEGFTARSSGYSGEGDEMMAYVFDVLGSVTVEKAAEKLIAEIEKEVENEGFFVGDSFSPGYCDWSVAEQKQLFSFFPKGFCGVCLSDSSLMSPIKSVSGIVGLGPEMKRKGYQCNWCSDLNCLTGRIRRKKAMA